MELTFEDAYAFDLLGSEVMPVRQHGALQLFRAIFRVVLGLSGVAGFFALLYFANARIIDWREYHYKKTIRRQYGIPDDDNDPFNVAFAKYRHLRPEVSEERGPQGSSRVGSTSTQKASPFSQGIDLIIPRRRIVPPTMNPSKFTSTQEDLVNKIKRMQPVIPGQKPFLKQSPDLACSSKAKPEVVTGEHASSSSQRKRSLEKEDPAAPAKKSRNEHSEQADPVGTKSSAQASENGVRDHAAAGNVRGAKRQAASDDDISIIGSVGKKAGKRARRQSKRLEEVLNVDENDDQMDVDHVSRGKKRDRSEADSSFGGDDDTVTGSHGRKSRRQKRKSSAAMEVDAPTPIRGTKRSYEAESTLGSDNDDSRSKSPRKRGKRMPKESHDVPTAHSAPDPSCAGRNIGEKWHANGVTYKVGPDGRRLRRVLLRKRASRFSMPEDSQHPDSRARLEILVETWLNDDAFKAAEKRGDVYVPDKKSKEVNEPVPLSDPGKSLLWAMKRNAARSTEDTFPIYNGASTLEPADHSVTGDAKPPNRALESLLESPKGSPTIRQSKSYSKWEKQDLEADAMTRLRKKLDDDRKAATPPVKKVSFQIPSSTTEPSMPAPSIVSSSSAPASFPASSLASKVPTSTSAPSVINLSVPSVAIPNTGQSAAPNAAPSATASSPVRPPVVTVTTPAPAKEPVPAPPPKFAFGPAPSGAQAAATPVKKKEQVTGTFSTSTPMQNTFAPRAQVGANAAASGSTANTFAKPAVPSEGLAAAPNGANGSRPTFSFGIKGPAQGEKPPGPPTPSPFGKPADKPVSSAPSVFSVPTNNATGSTTSNATAFGTSSSGRPAQPGSSSISTAPTAPMPQFSFGVPMSKPSDTSKKPSSEPSASGAGTTAPKFNFGFGTKPAASPLPNQAGPVPATAKPATSASPFAFGLNPNAPNPPSVGNASVSAPTPSSGPTAPAPKFTFGAPPVQPSSSAMPAPAAPTPAPKFAFGTRATQPQASATAAPAGFSAAPKFQFGAPAAQTFPGAPAPGGTTSDSGAMTGITTTNEAPASTSFGFGASKPAASAVPSSSPFGTTAASPSPFGSTSSSTANPPGTSAPPFGTSTAPSPFGGAFKAGAPSVSPFGTQTAQTKPPAPPASAAPKSPMFMFGASNNNASSMNTNGPTRQAQDNNKTTFSFNFGAPSSLPGQSQSGPAGGAKTPMFVFGSGSKPPSSSPFGAPAASGNANSNNNTQNQAPGTGPSAFGSSSGPSPFGGQR